LYDAENVADTPVRLAVVKKNAAVLRKLVNDLHAIKTPLGEIPELIIDAEAGGIHAQRCLSAICPGIVQYLRNTLYRSGRHLPSRLVVTAWHIRQKSKRIRGMFTRSSE